MVWGANAYVVQSATEGDDLFLLVTVEKRDPLRPAHLYVEAGFLWNRPGVVTLHGDVLRAERRRRPLRGHEHAVPLRGARRRARNPHRAAEDARDVRALVQRRRAEHEARLASWGPDARATGRVCPTELRCRMTVGAAGLLRLDHSRDDLELVTGNVKHFRRVPGLRILSVLAGARAPS
jgi:hypothetical protein